MDILEFFINKTQVFLILLMDDFSRFILGWQLLDQTSIDSVISVVAGTMDRHGKMEEVLTDRGFVLYSWRGINRFEKYLETERTEQTRFSKLHETQAAIEGWIEHYNYQRPHQGIGGFLVPARLLLCSINRKKVDMAKPHK